MTKISLIFFVLILLGTVTVVIFHHYRYARTYKGLLFSAVSSADRIEIQTSVYWHDNGGELLYEIKGREKVKEILKLMQFDEGKFRKPCPCDGDYWIAFLKKNEEPATLEVHETNRLRWRGGKWPGDIYLTNESAKSVEKWLRAEGFDFKYMAEEYRVE